MNSNSNTRLSFKEYAQNYHSSEERKKKFHTVYVILGLISYLLLIGILGVVYHVRSTEDDKFNFIYDMSKILTIKSIVINNHYSELLESYSPTGEPETLARSYRNYLKLVKNKNGCATGYKSCGILDTYGNALCIDELYQCPVNKMKVAHSTVASTYLDNGYKTAPLDEISPNYQFFYSNNFNEGNGVVIIIKTKDEPKFIRLNNFVLDSELYKELFGDDELLKDIADILGVGEEETSEGEIVDTVIKIFQVINEVEEVISEFDWKLKGAQLLVKVLLREYNKRVERFQNFVKEKIEILDEKNNDIYYEHIGDNFYSKNYIGFKSVQDIDKFLRFDYEIYKKIFPNFSAANAALAPVIILSIFLFGLIIVYFAKHRANFHYILFIFNTILFIIPALGFVIYGLVTYFKVNKSKTLDDLNSIESDAFIKEMINDFIKECQKGTLVLSTIGIISFSIILYAIGSIFYFKSLSED